MRFVVISFNADEPEWAADFVEEEDEERAMSFVEKRRASYTAVCALSPEWLREKRVELEVMSDQEVREAMEDIPSA